MQNDIGQPCQTPQGGRPVEVGNQRTHPLVTPECRLRRITQQGENPVTAKQMGKGATGNVAAPDNEKCLHGRILPDYPVEAVSKNVASAASWAAPGAQGRDSTRSTARSEHRVRPKWQAQ